MKLNKNLAEGFWAMFGVVAGLYAGAWTVNKISGIGKKEKTEETEEATEE